MELMSPLALARLIHSRPFVGTTADGNVAGRLKSGSDFRRPDAGMESRRDFVGILGLEPKIPNRAPGIGVTT
jgi:hypothetical protein